VASPWDYLKRPFSPLAAKNIFFNSFKKLQSNFLKELKKKFHTGGKERSFETALGNPQKLFFYQ